MEEKNVSEKKRIRIIIIILIVFALLIPIPNKLRDGGTVEYNALTYKITKIHKLNENALTGYDVGTKVEILGIQVYNDIVETSPVVVKTYEMENVTMVIKEGTLTNTGATIIITDTNTKKYTFGQEYIIEKKVTDGWEEVKKINNNYEFTELAIVAGENDTVTENINWKDLYGKLDNGQYRIIKKVTDKMFSGIVAEFEIKN